MFKLRQNQNIDCTTSEDEKLAFVKKSLFFDKKWYAKTYHINGNEAEHYCNIGYKLGYNPSPKFSRIKYELIYDDVRYVKANPIWHFEKYGKYEPKFLARQYISSEDKKLINKCIKLQDEHISIDYSADIKKLIVFLVPELDIVSGGVMSINSIAKLSKKMKKIHDSEVIVCTMPNERTFFKYTKFTSDFNIYRFDQLKDYFKKLESIIINIPEIYVNPFLYFVTPEEQNWIKNIKVSTFNILNQNNDLMPRPRLVNYLRSMANNITITCAHKRYCVPQLRSSYNASVHWLSASNMVKYKYVNYKQKKDILVYSPDYHPMKQIILKRIKDEFPNLQLIEIKNLKYQDYLKLIGKAKWMITFGEGLDGYFAESIRSGTIAFAAYNFTFFNESYDNLKNVYSSYNNMLENIVNDMRKFDNEKIYERIVQKCYQIDQKEYCDSEYIKNIEKYYKGEYTYPFAEVLEKRKNLLNRKPLISIAVATYNGEKYIEKQINSLLNLDYKNIEIIVSDDYSTDNTYKILRKYGNKINLIKNEGKRGLNSNFANAIKKCKGEYIALCDQDDIWEKNKLNILLEHIDDFDLVHGGVSIIDQNDEYHKNKIMHDVYEIDKTRFYKFTDYVKENLLLGCTCLISKKFLDKYIDIPEDTLYHDWWIVLNAIKNGRGIVYVDEEIIKYRQHKNNTAFKTFNSEEWNDKKVAFNSMLLKTLKLNKIEKELLLTDSNYLIIKKVMKKYLPNLTEEFTTQNYSYFTEEFVNEIKQELEKKV